MQNSASIPRASEYHRPVSHRIMGHSSEFPASSVESISSFGTPPCEIFLLLLWTRCCCCNSCPPPPRHLNQMICVCIRLPPPSPVHSKHHQLHQSYCALYLPASIPTPNIHTSMSARDFLNILQVMYP